MITGNELKALRKEKLGLTQDMLAKELGVSRPTVSSWEKLGENYVDRMVFLSVQALVHLSYTRSWGADGLDTFEEGAP